MNDDDDNNELLDSDDEDQQQRRRARLQARVRQVRERKRRREEPIELHQPETTEVPDPVVESEPEEDDEIPEEEEDGEDLLENAERDYQRIEALDTYGAEGLDDQEYDLIAPDQRRAAEAALARRDRRDLALDVDEDAEDDEARDQRRKVFVRDEASDEESDDEDLDRDDAVNLEAFDVPLREWIAQDRTRKEIQRKFRAFCRHFQTDTTKGYYEAQIRHMCAANQGSLQVSYLHLMEAEPVLAFWLADAPKDMLQVLHEAATKHTLSLFPSYHAIRPEIFVRISNLPLLDSLRDLRRSHLDGLVQVHGVVTRRSTVFPQLHVAYYTCLSCQRIQGPFRNTGMGAMDPPDGCPFCETSALQLQTSLSKYRNVQKVNLQESPGSVPPGRVPRSQQVLLADDLIDTARPGEEVEVTGIYEHSFDASLTIQSGFPVFGTFLTANHIQARHQVSSSLSEDDVAQILELSKDPQIGKRIVQSVAPSIYGLSHCKMALAMSLFGGCPKHNDKHRIRGDVNVLLLGDPGTAKSQLLKYAEKTAPRAVYSTGKGASAVGLTASVHKDPITKEWTLEGGALVLADKGVCLIDEFDKMNEQDRTSIHEAMEQQSISVSKAGIVTSLQARCSVIAAANPIGGRYDSSRTLADNVELTDPILQRFDVLCVLKDTVDPVADERLANFVTGSHCRAVPTREYSPDQRRQHQAEAENSDTLIPQALLRKYIQYARANVHPVLNGNALDQEKVSSLYVALRRESAGGVPIAVRHIESILRMAEAHAKMHLRPYVRDDDLDASIQMMLESFVSAQKFSVQRSLRRSFAKYWVSNDDRAQLLLHLLQDLFRQEHVYQAVRRRQAQEEDDDDEALTVAVHDLATRARERKVYNIQEFLQSDVFAEAGYLYDEGRQVIVRN